MNDIDLRIERMLQLSADLLEQQELRAKDPKGFEKPKEARAEACDDSEKETRDFCF